MLYLSGAKNKHVLPYMEARVIGLIQGPKSGYALDGIKVWAQDNGCFTNTYPGDDAYLAILERQKEHRDRCLFATAPDVVGDAVETIKRSTPMLPRIRDAGYPAALVGQDGMEDLEVPWHLVDVLFVGGSTEWKMSEGAAGLIAEAHSLGKKVHCGRVNSGKRFKHFEDMGVESCDGTFLAFGPEVNLKRLLKWINVTSTPTEASA